MLWRFRSAFLYTLLNLNVSPGVAVYHRLMIFSTINAQDLIIQRKKFNIFTLKPNAIFWHCKKNSDYFWTRLYVNNTVVPVLFHSTLIPPGLYLLGISWEWIVVWMFTFFVNLFINMKKKCDPLVTENNLALHTDCFPRQCSCLNVDVISL